MSDTAYALFDSPIGCCGLAWSARGLIGVQLPEGREHATRERLAERFPEAVEDVPPPEIRSIIDRIVALLRGEAIDLSTVPLDMSDVPVFHQRVYEAARRIPCGKTVSYGDLASTVGANGSARAVGQALGRNPFALVVPCHRVLASDGRLGGFSANGGVTAKLRLLTIEGAATHQRGILFEGDGHLGFDPLEATRHVREADEALARVIDMVGPFDIELKRTPSVFAALAESIVYQQLTGRAAATIFARVRALFPYAHQGPSPEQVLRVSDAKLREAGLSRSKILSLRDLARRCASGEIPRLEQLQKLDDEAIISSLTHVRGIGRWTVEMLLIFRLGRPDVLPLDDYGVRKGFAVTHGLRDLPERAELAAYGERWKPYRTVASWYLWRALELPAPM